MSDGEKSAYSAFIFHGRWQEFAPIALTNLLLTIATLGIYRFWATTRERRYFWSRSQFIDERLEWTGTGLELFLGFLLVLLLFGIPFFALQFGVQALALQGYAVLAGFVSIAALVWIFYLWGVAKFRALRYRMGRTYWRGIRGGSNDTGFKYGGSHVWKNAAGFLPAGLLIPWSMVSLWNERWSAMSFGSHKVEANASFEGLMKRFLLFYLSPVLLVAAIFIFGLFAAGIVAITGPIEGDSAEPPAAFILLAFLFIMLIYLVVPLIWLIFYAKFYRTAVNGMTLHTLDFNFTARTKSWLWLFFGDAALWVGAAVVAALPILLGLAAFGLFDGLQITEPGQSNPAFETAILASSFVIFIVPFALVGPFIRYRHWKFFITHMEAYGEINVDRLTQSTMNRAGHGEGLLDAFDVGAI